MKQTRIEWCDATLNPVVGCTFGCLYCYARKMNQRFHWTKNFSTPEFFPERLEQLEQQRPARIFMNSMSDIADWNLSWAVQTTQAMRKNPQHKYLFLTKRPQAYLGWNLFEDKNVWCGFTITSNETKPKSEHEMQSVSDILSLNQNANWFVSVEPLLGPVDLTSELKKGLKWIIIGAETGPGKHKHTPSLLWIRNIVAQAAAANAPVFMKDSLAEIVPKEEFLQVFPAGLEKINLKERRWKGE